MSHLPLQSADVIHSFWLPQLNGKTDLDPQDLKTGPLMPDMQLHDKEVDAVVAYLNTLKIKGDRNERMYTAEIIR
jgi:hypothetical protein